MKKRHPPRFCTTCGARCTLTPHGRPHWSRGVYGLFSEPRCSQRCASKPVVDVDAQRMLERMGDIVVAARVYQLSEPRTP